RFSSVFCTFTEFKITKNNSTHNIKRIKFFCIEDNYFIYSYTCFNRLYICCMKKIAVIPARYASVRFHGKLMQLLDEKTIIATTYQNTLTTNLFDDVLVVTDSD